jgi:hypothetical protein
MNAAHVDAVTVGPSITGPAAGPSTVRQFTLGAERWFMPYGQDPPPA